MTNTRNLHSKIIFMHFYTSNAEITRKNNGIARSPLGSRFFNDKYTRPPLQACAVFMQRKVLSTCFGDFKYTYKLFYFLKGMQK